MRHLLVLSLIATVAVSRADSLNITNLALGGNTGTLALSDVAGMASGSYYAGPFDASLNGATSIRVFCGDLLDHTQFNTSTAVTLRDTATLGGGYGQAAQLLNKYASTAGDDPLKNAALQAAVWKSLFPTLTFSDGTPGASALAQTYLASDLSGYSAHATFYDFGGANQSMIGVQATPEPASFAAIVVGGAGLLRRRKRA